MDDKQPALVGVVKPDGVQVVFDMSEKIKSTISVHGKPMCWERITGTELALLALLGIK